MEMYIATERADEGKLSLIERITFGSGVIHAITGDIKAWGVAKNFKAKDFGGASLHGDLLCCFRVVGLNTKSFLKL